MRGNYENGFVYIIISFITFWRGRDGARNHIIYLNTLALRGASLVWVPV